MKMHNFLQIILVLKIMTGLCPLKKKSIKLEQSVYTTVKWSIALDDYLYLNESGDTTDIVCAVNADLCTVICDGSQTCKDRNIYCPTSNSDAICDITCTGPKACHQAYVYGTCFVYHPAFVSHSKNGFFS